MRASFTSNYSWLTKEFILFYLSFYSVSSYSKFGAIYKHHTGNNFGYRICANSTMVWYEKNKSRNPTLALTWIRSGYILSANSSVCANSLLILPIYINCLMLLLTLLLVLLCICGLQQKVFVVLFKLYKVLAYFIITLSHNEIIMEVWFLLRDYCITRLHFKKLDLLYVWLLLLRLLLLWLLLLH